MRWIFGPTPLLKIFTNDTLRVMQPETAASAIARASGVLGSQLALANAIKVAPAQVSQWANGVRPVPAHYCVDIERATAGAVSRADLRPADYWRIWPDMKAPRATRSKTKETA